MRPQDDINAEESERRMLDRVAALGRAEADFVAAVRTARAARTEAGLDCYFDDEGNAHFTQEQGLKAACHTREDAAASLMLQMQIMKRLDRNSAYLKWGIALLAALLLIHITK